MARVKVPIVVINSSTGLPVNGASVALSLRSSGAPATWFATELGSTGSTASVVTDASGRVTAWVDRGAYNATISGTGITTYTESFDAATSSDSSVDSKWMDPTVLLPGEVKMYAGATAPAGWLVCDGSLVSRTTYAALFAAVGTAFGAGDGSTTFALPDFRGRSPVGSGTGSGLAARTRGQTGGEETHALTSLESGVNQNGSVAAAGAHGHAITVDPIIPWATGWNVPISNTAWSIQIASTTGSGPQNGFAQSPGGTITYSGGAHGHTASASAVGDHAHGLNVRNADQAHNNMHPYAVLHFIIKV